MDLYVYLLFLCTYKTKRFITKLEELKWFFIRFSSNKKLQKINSIFVIMNRNYSLSDIQSIAKEILNFSTYKCFLFYGEMGVGKTTLIKEIAKELKVIDTVNSPTFSLVNEYRTNEDSIIFHFDFYRIDDENEALHLGFEEYFYSGNLCLIEWPENIKNIVPLEAVHIHLTRLESGMRTIQIKQE